MGGVRSIGRCTYLGRGAGGSQQCFQAMNQYRYPPNADLAIH